MEVEVEVDRKGNFSFSTDVGFSHRLTTGCSICGTRSYSFRQPSRYRALDYLNLVM